MRRKINLKKKKKCEYFTKIFYKKKKCKKAIKISFIYIDMGFGLLPCIG